MRNILSFARKFTQIIQDKNIKEKAAYEFVRGFFLYEENKEVDCVKLLQSWLIEAKFSDIKYKNGVIDKKYTEIYNKIKSSIIVLGGR